MAIKIAINGFGRIGRLFFRALKGSTDIEVVAINDLADAETLAVLLKYDSVHGRYDGDVTSAKDGDKECIIVDGQQIPCLTVRSPADLPWAELGVEIVVESTGVFRSKEAMQGHIDAGAKKVLLSAPPKGEIDATIVFGVNDETLKATDVFVSNASCTTNCLAPVVKVLNDTFGIEMGLMTTCHGYTNDQVICDFMHTDLRRARAGALNIIPTTTGAAAAVGKVIPELNGKLNGFALRVPVPDGSIVDLVAITKTPVTVESVNAAVKAAADGPMKGILEYSTDPIVSSDIIDNCASSIFDAPLTMVMGENMVKVVSWYDNEMGYSTRCVELIRLMA
ncbi:type I glyceraldehyde-3-phosphate dehydrogenase [bacterium]|nr:type I glyceraldehyde-3-phosphate dehydrogenase [bacterium]